MYNALTCATSTKLPRQHMTLALSYCNSGGFVIKAEIPLLKLLKTCCTNGNKNLKNDRTVNSSNRHSAPNYGQSFEVTSLGIQKCVRSLRGGRLREQALVRDQVKRVFCIRRAVTYESF